jgi:hypothetical protein
VADHSSVFPTDQTSPLFEMALEAAAETVYNLLLEATFEI